MTILATGGTIATVTAPDGTTRPRMTGDDLAALIPQPPAADIVVEQMTQVPSWSLTPRDMVAIASRARDVAATNGPVVVTHGTSTLEFTAFFTDLILGGPEPVVFTGAMRRADEAEADGPRNLADAIAVAVSPEAREMGSLVSFAGEIFVAREVTKLHRDSLAPFASEFGPVGQMTAEGPRFGREPTRSHTFEGRIEERVALVKAYPGSSAAAVRSLIEDGARGLVVEGLPGAGGVPSEMRPGIAAAVENGLAVVLASSARYGRMITSGGGTGEPLRDLRLIPAGSLAAEKAWVLLSLALGESAEPEHVREVFERFSRDVADD